jgi:NitT/TauT family transport system substrate-binding protein
MKNERVWKETTEEKGGIMVRRKRISLIIMGLVISMGIAGIPGKAAAQTTNITFALDFTVLGRHAPWYVALDKGYYKQEGLNVEIIPGKGTAQVIQALESGLAQFAFADVPGLILARPTGATSKMVAVNYQKAPYTIFSLDPGANVTKPEDLVGLTMGGGAGSFVPKVIEGFMRQKGLDPSTLKVVNTDPAARIGMLVSRKVPSVDFFIMSLPGIERAVKDAKVRAFLLADFGLELYANGIAVREETIKQNPNIVKAFVKASLQGWKTALADPEGAADCQMRHAKGLDRDGIVEEVKILRRLAIVPDTEKNGLGWFDPAKIQANLQFMVANVGITGTPPKPEDLYDTGFLPKPPILP